MAGKVTETYQLTCFCSLSRVFIMTEFVITESDRINIEVILCFRETSFEHQIENHSTACSFTMRKFRQFHKYLNKKMSTRHIFSFPEI